ESCSTVITLSLSIATCTLLNNPIAHQYLDTAFSSSGASTLHDCRDSALFEACDCGATRSPIATSAAIAASTATALAVYASRVIPAASHVLGSRRLDRRFLIRSAASRSDRRASRARPAPASRRS